MASEHLDTFGRLNKSSHDLGEFFLFYGHHTVSRGSRLIALVAGEAAQAFETTDPTVLLHRVSITLKGTSPFMYVSLICLFVSVWIADLHFHSHA